MRTDSVTQASSILTSAKTAAILLPQTLTLDHICAAIALQEVLHSHGVAASIFSSAEVIPPLPFLTSQPIIRKAFSKGDQFAVKISSVHAKPGELRYEVEDDGVVIYLKSQSGEFRPEDVSVVPGRKKFDVLVSVGVQNMEQLGSVYTDNAAVFFETPHLVIDILPTNEYFGTTNIVQVTASSLSEVVMDVVSAFPESLKSDQVSTALLAGIISKTHSFRDPRTTPGTLAKSAQLVEAGARQQDIIQHLFKTKPLPVLQLWGRALARIATLPEHSALYSSVTQSDFDKTGATTAVLPEVLRDMVEMVTGFSLVALFVEAGQGVQVLLAGLPHVDLASIGEQLGAHVSASYPLTGKYVYINETVTAKTVSEMQQQFAVQLKTMQR